MYLYIYIYTSEGGRAWQMLEEALDTDAKRAHLQELMFRCASLAVRVRKAVVDIETRSRHTCTDDAPHLPHLRVSLRPH